MGTYAAHVVTGLFMMIYGLWWTAHIWRRRMTSSRLHQAYKASLSLALPCGRGCLIPMDAVIKIVLTLLVYVVEIESYEEGDDWFYSFITSQHVQIFNFYMLSGVVDILVSIKRLNIPSGMEYVAWALALFMEGLIFLFHSKGGSELEMLLHTLVMYCSFGCTITILLEMWQRNNALISLMRSLLMQVRGSWIIQVGVVLYSKDPALRWSGEDDDSIMRAVTFFALHVSLNFISMLVLGGVVAAFASLYRRNRGDGPNIARPEWKQVPLITADMMDYED